MASRETLARALAQLQHSPGYRDYVHTLEAERASTIHKLLYAQAAGEVEVLRGEARAYDRMLTTIKSNQESSS